VPRLLLPGRPQHHLRLKQVRRYVDSGYQGYNREHPNLEFPYKKPKGGALTGEEREYNRALSSFLVRVEHRIGRTKRFRIVGDRFRNPSEPTAPQSSLVSSTSKQDSGRSDRAPRT
jgi:hypothetical protein